VRWEKPHSHNPRVHAEQTLCRLSHPTDTSVNLTEVILAEGTANSEEVAYRSKSRARDGILFQSGRLFIWPDLSGVAMGRTGAKPDDNMIQVAVPKRHVIQNQTAIGQ